MTHLNKLLFVVAALPPLFALGGCPDFVIPPDAIVACGKDGDCPAGSSCNADIDRCVPDAPVEEDAPVLSDINVSPRRGGLDTTFALTFTVDEALAKDPVVAVAGVDVETVGGDRNDAATPWSFSFAASSAMSEGDNDISVTVVDVWGNARTQVLEAAFSVDFSPPVIDDPNLDAVIGDPNLSFTVRLQGASRLRVSGDLEDDKDLVVTGEAVDVDVVFTAGDGRKQLRLEAEDDVGNVSRLDLEVTIDSSVPFSRPTIAARGGQTAIKNDDVVDVSGSVTPGATIIGVKLVDEDGADIGNVSGVIVDAVTGVLSGSVDVGDLGGAAEARLVVTVVKAAVASPEAQSRSNALVVDNVAPANASCALPARSTSANVSFVLAADDFIDVEVTGDVVDARPFAPLVGGTANLILSAGEGEKTLTARFRDGAHNLTPCSATTTLDVSAPVLSNVLLSPPAGQTAVQSDQTVTVSAVVDVAGASVVSARLLDQGFNFIDDIDGLVVNGVNVSGSFVVDDLVTASVAGLVVELVVAEGGLQSLPVRSPQLNVDDVPPTDPVVSAPADAAAFDVDLAIAGCVGAAEVAVSGDLAAGSGVFVPFANPLAVVLSAGAGEKVLDVVCRDGAFNVSGSDSVVVNLTTDDVLSRPTLSAPAGQTAIKNGDTLTIGGAGESGAVVTSVRLVDTANGNTAQALPASTVTLTGTTLSGSFAAAGLSNNQNVVLEVILSARARASVAADSRSDVLAVDVAVPAAPVANKLRLVETTASANDPARVDDAANNALVASAIAGAVVDASFVELCGDAACASVVAGPIAVDGGGGFSAQNLAFRANHDIFVRGVDGAKNKGNTTRIVVPRITFASVAPAVANVDDDVVISFSTSVAVRANPVVLVDGNAAVLQSQTGNNFVFRYNTLGSEGDGPAVVRVTAEDAATFAAGTTGTEAVVTTLDFTAPVIDAAKITLSQNDPGTADTVTSAAGAVVDALDGVVDLEFRGDGNVVASRATSADGSFAAVSLGDNVVSVVVVTASDDAGNTRTLTLDNDRVAPVISNVSVSDDVAKNGDVLALSFRIVDAQSALRADPVVVVGGRAATRVGGNSAESPVSEDFSYTFTVNGAVDDEGANDVDIDVVDVRGNASSAAADVVFDFTPPALRNTTPGDRAVWNLAPAALGTVDDAGSGLAATGTVSVRHCDTLAPCVGAVVFTGAIDNVGRGWSGVVDDAAFVDGDDYEATFTWLDLAGNSSSVVRAFEHDDVPQAQPIALEAVVVDGDVLLAWTPSDDPVADTFNVYYDDFELGAPPYNGTDAAEGISPLDVDGLAFDGVTVSGLDSGDHVFVVTGVSAAGESAYSNEVIVTIP